MFYFSMIFLKHRIFLFYFELNFNKRFKNSTKFKINLLFIHLSRFLTVMFITIQIIVSTELNQYVFKIKINIKPIYENYS